MRDDDTPSTLDSRLEALESRIAHQEDWLDTLDRAVAQQERRLMHLERLSALMQEKIREQQLARQDDEAAAPHPQDEVPPHY
ncbi:SlyX family protein [Halomonas sp. M4R1S46]|uniref:SlyX family protein n=1 Tax=Halomonas sp. M4R1S46 TaxID=2982692 RepID=UPI0021E4F48A|nr:SlyX family protein [Halomonas sp. M4R1S46]UYG08170.1 SlyX family protein [Halomonas sp. M4R1S46]